MKDNYTPNPIRKVNLIRYIQPLREGGSLPAIAEADDGFMYVIKFRGAGQGAKALIAELLGGEIARALDIPIPEIVFAELDEAFGRTEPDEEIQDLLKASTGLNLGIHFLSGALTYEPASLKIDNNLASKIVWLDNLITNVDRTVKNTNLLLWHKELWVIDNGASLYFHHNWEHKENAATKTFAPIKDHVLLHQAGQLNEINEWAKKRLTPTFINTIVGRIPEEWLQWEGTNDTPEIIREVYAAFLNQRIAQSDAFTQHAIDARQALI